MKRKFLTLAMIAAALTLAYTAYALTASNTVPATTAGDGTGSVSGFTATSVGYTLNGTTPTNVDAVTFTIAPTTTSTVKAKMNSTWYSCTNSSGSVSCATTSPQLTLSAITSLEVIAVG
jgi:hypothetical protein